MQNVADVDLSQIILSNILKNETYANKVIPELSIDFFVNETEKLIAQTIIKLYTQYSTIPSVKELVADMRSNNNVHNLSKTIINEILGTGIIIENQKWLIDQTERFIKRQRTSLVFMKTFEEYEHGNVDVTEFSKQFQEAAAFTFDNNVGMSLINDASARYDLYTKKHVKIPFGLKWLDKVTYGGMEDGTLNLVLAGINAGKSLFMGDIAAKCASRGGKVLVISLEMAEIKLIERIESNLMDVPIGNIRKMSKAEYMIAQKNYINEINVKGGDIIFKQYPTKAANVNHFRNLLIECKNKLRYDFDLVVIDYLNICGCSSTNRNMNSYSEVKAIAEELRALAIEFSFPILSASQVNKDAQSNTHINLEDIAESIGLAATADFVMTLVATETMIEQNQVKIGQVKSRYGDKSYNTNFMLGLDRKYMRLYDIDDELSSSEETEEITSQEFDLSALTGD